MKEIEVESTSLRERFMDLVDRSLIIVVTQCETCGGYFARVKYPTMAKLDRICDAKDHTEETGHTSFKALKILILYMNQADKDLANELSEAQRKAFHDFLETFK